MDGHAYQLLYESIHDYKRTAVKVESEIQRLGLRSDSYDVVPEINGRRRHSISMPPAMPPRPCAGHPLHLMIAPDMQPASNRGAIAAITVLIAAVFEWVNRGFPAGRRNSCRWRGGPAAGVRNLRHQEPAGSYRTQPKDRRGRCDIGVHIADIQGGEDAEGYRECGSGVMTVRREQTATGSAMSSLHMEPGRFLYDDGHTTTVRPASGKPKACAGLGVAPLPARMPDRIGGKKVVGVLLIDDGKR